MSLGSGGCCLNTQTELLKKEGSCFYPISDRNVLIFSHKGGLEYSTGPSSTYGHVTSELDLRGNFDNFLSSLQTNTLSLHVLKQTLRPIFKKRKTLPFYWVSTIFKIVCQA